MEKKERHRSVSEEPLPLHRAEKTAKTLRVETINNRIYQDERLLREGVMGNQSHMTFLFRSILYLKSHTSRVISSVMY